MGVGVGVGGTATAIAAINVAAAAVVRLEECRSTLGHAISNALFSQKNYDMLTPAPLTPNQVLGGRLENWLDKTDWTKLIGQNLTKVVILGNSQFWRTEHDM